MRDARAALAEAREAEALRRAMEAAEERERASAVAAPSPAVAAAEAELQILRGQAGAAEYRV